MPQGPNDVSTSRDVQRDFATTKQIGHSASLQTVSRLATTAVGYERRDLRAGHGDPAPRRLQHARQPVLLERRPDARRDERRTRPPASTSSSSTRRATTSTAAAWRWTACFPDGTKLPFAPARPRPGLQLDPAHDSPPELPRPAAAAPLVPARRAAADVIRAAPTGAARTPRRSRADLPRLARRGDAVAARAPPAEEDVGWFCADRLAEDELYVFEPRRRGRSAAALLVGRRARRRSTSRRRPSARASARRSSRTSRSPPRRLRLLGVQRQRARAAVLRGPRRAGASTRPTARTTRRSVADARYEWRPSREPAEA